jgi:hypothetical protein
MIHQNCRRPNLEKFLPTYLKASRRIGLIGKEQLLAVVHGLKSRLFT